MSDRRSPEKEIYWEELQREFEKLADERSKLLAMPPFEIGGVKRMAEKKPEMLNEADRERLEEIDRRIEEIKKELGLRDTREKFERFSKDK